MAEQALALLRNVVCTYDEDAEPAFGLAGVGEDRLLSILTARLVDDKDEAMLQNVSLRQGWSKERHVVEMMAEACVCTFILCCFQGLFTLVNLATEGELTRLAIAARDDLLQATMYHLVNSLLRSSFITSLSTPTSAAR